MKEILAGQKEKMRNLLVHLEIGTSGVDSEGQARNDRNDIRENGTTPSTLTADMLTNTTVDPEALHALNDNQIFLTRSFDFLDRLSGASSVALNTGTDNPEPQIIERRESGQLCASLWFSISEETPSEEKDSLVDQIPRAFRNRPFLVRTNDIPGMETVDFLSGMGVEELNEWLRTQREWMAEVAKSWVKGQLQEREDPVNPAPNQAGSGAIHQMEQVHDRLVDLLKKRFVEHEPEGSERRPGDFVSTLQTLCTHSNSEVPRNPQVSVAICGMVKAGKSFFLNALIGQAILPSGELPATAVPCCVRHVPGQKEPLLEVVIHPFLFGLNALRERRYGEAMANYQPSQGKTFDADPFADLLGSSDSDSASLCSDDLGLDGEEGHLREVYLQWVDLDPSTRSNLLRFEEAGFQFASTAIGKQDVVNLLEELNDVVRPCYRFGIEIPMQDAMWPVISVEFEALRDASLDGTFQFIDLPGIGESFSMGQSMRGMDVFDPFDQIMCRVSKEADAMIPIVSFSEIPKADWRRKLPPMIQSGIGKPPEFVICTHLDKVKGTALREQVAAVAKTFWPSVPNETASKRVLACSSLLGMNALQLLHQSAVEKPSYKRVWDEDSLGFHCAERILGVGNSEGNHSTMSFETWKSAVEAQLSSSQLYSTIQRLTTDLVNHSRRRMLRQENELLRRLVSEAVRDQKAELLDMSGAEQDFKQARVAVLEAKRHFSSVLQTWDDMENKMKSELQEKVKKALEVLRKSAARNLVRDLEVTYSEFVRERTRTPTRVSLDTNGEVDADDSLVFRKSLQAEVFLYIIQQRLRDDLSLLKNQFVAFVRKVCHQTRDDYFSKISWKSGTDSEETELNSEIAQKIEEYCQWHSLKRREPKYARAIPPGIGAGARMWLKSVSVKYTAGTAYTAIQNALATPLLPSIHNSSEDGDVNAVSAPGVEKLGLLTRAPIAAVAVLPWVLGAGVWSFMVKEKAIYPV